MRFRQWVGVAVLAIALVGLAFRFSYEPSAAPSAAVPTPVESSMPPTSQPEETVAPSPIRKQRVRLSEVEALRIPGVLTASFGGAISPNEDNALNPPTSTEVFRWAERGLPGCPSRDTVFLLGHTVRAGGGVFDRLQAVSLGQDIVLTTENGVIRYKVVSTELYDRAGITEEDDVYASHPGRLVLVGCFLNADGSQQTENFVVTARAVNC